MMKKGKTMDIDLPFWKNISQGVVFFGAFVVIVGQIGLWHINNKIAAEKKTHIDNITGERDQAIAKLKRLSTNNILLTEFSGALDNKIKTIWLEIDFKISTIDKYFNDFYCYILLGALDVCYEIISAPPNPLGMGHKITAYTAHYSKAFGSEEKKWVMWQFLPDQMSLRDELFIFLGESRKKCVIRTFQGSHFQIAVKEKYIQFISGVRIIVNGWKIYDRKPNTEDWIFWPGENRIRQKGIGKLFVLKNPDTQSNRSLYTFDLLRNVPIKIPQSN